MYIYVRRMIGGCGRTRNVSSNFFSGESHSPWGARRSLWEGGKSAHEGAILYCGCGLFILQAALATSVNLRCYVIFTPTQDRRVTLHLPDFVPDSDSEIKRTWTIEELENVQKMDDQEVQLKTLKMLPGVSYIDTVL